MRPKTDKSELISNIYQAALNPGKLTEFLSAWDEYVLSPRTANEIDGGARTSERDINAKDLSELAKHALEVFNLNKQAGSSDVSALLANKQYAAFVSDMHGRLVQSNEAANARFSLNVGDAITDLAIDPQSEAEFFRGLRKYHNHPTAFANELLPLRLLLKDQRSVLLITEIVKSRRSLEGPLEDFILFKSCTPEWTDIASKLLVETFAYTRTELEVLRSLTDGFTTKQISEKRSRALQTVKKQIKSLLRKTGVNSQSELIRIVSGVLHICTSQSAKSGFGFENWRSGKSFQRIDALALDDDCEMEFVRCGAMDGEPVLFIHGNSSPILPRTNVEMVADCGLQLVSPLKPGGGKTRKDPAGYDPDQYMHDCVCLMQRLGFEKFSVAGHTLGGIYCLKAVSQAPEAIRSVGLIDTGAPISSTEIILQMPENSRRTFLGARETPDALYTAYAMAADLFFRDEGGRKVIMGLAYADSPHDTKLATQGDFEQIIERNLTYVLSDPTRTVDDLILWMRDWTELYRTVLKTHPILFMHGQEHDFLSAKYVTRFCEEKPNAHCRIVEGGSQLWIYERPNELAAGLTQLLSLTLDP